MMKHTQPQPLPLLDVDFDIDDLLALCDFSELELDPPRSPSSLQHPNPQHQKLVQHTVLPAWLVSPPPITCERRRKRTAERRKDEIELLRRQVSELQAELANTSPISKSTPRVVLEPPSEGTAHYLWLKLAQRQESERRRVEEVNARLREALSSQDKLIWNLHRVLRQSEHKSKQAFPNRTNWEPSCDDIDIVSVLVANVEKQLLTWTAPDTVYQQENYGEKHIGQIRKDSSGGYLYERERAQVFPFSADLVNKVKWCSFSTGGVFVAPQPATVASDDIIISTISFHSSLFEIFCDPEMLGIKTHFVVKRRWHHGRMVSAFEAVSFVPVSRTLGTPALRWTVRGQNFTWPHQLPNGAEGAASWARFRASVTVDGDTNAELGEQGLKMVRVIAAAIEETGKRAEQTFENMLLMEARNKRRRLR